MKISAISISERKGIRKKNVESAVLVENFGVEGDAHGGKWHRQLSFLAQESIDFMREKGLDVVAGNFAENITTTGIDLPNLKVGTHLQVGETEVIISQLGKVCHHRCAIYHQAGDCVMPREGIFAIVIKGGTIKLGDPITILETRSTSGGIVGTGAVENEFGDQLKETMVSNFSCAFVRFDRLNKEQDNLPAILNDLTDLQKIDHVLLYDPDGLHQMALAGYQLSDKQQNSYTKDNTTIYYCRTMEDARQFELLNN